MFNRIFAEYKNNVWVLLAMSVAVAALIVGWWVVSDSLSVVSDTLTVNATDNARNNDADTTLSPAMDAAGQADEIDALKDTLRDLNETARMLMDSISYLETKLIRAHVLSDDLIENEETLAIARVEPGKAQPASQPGTESPAAPAAGMIAEKPPESTIAPDATKAEDGKTSRQPSEDAERQEPVTVASRKTPETPEILQPAGAVRKQERSPVARTPPSRPTQRRPDSAPATAVTSPNADQTGEWVINLASLRSLKQAENFKSRAGMKGFGTSIQQVSVKGSDYWRVQVTGLATREDAESRGEAIKQRLGLKDIWISRRR